MKIKMDIVRQAETIIARGDNPDLTVEDVITEVPGVCFTRLLGIIPSQVYEGNVLMQNGLTAKVIKDSIDKALHFKCTCIFQSKMKIEAELIVFYVFQVT